MRTTTFFYGRGTPFRQPRTWLLAALLALGSWRVGLGHTPRAAVLPTSSPTMTARRAHADNDPLVFALRSNKARVMVGEEVELTVTVRYLNLSPTVRHLAGGSNAYALRLLLPDGFEATESPLTAFVRGWLSPARPEVSYTVRGRFVRMPAEATFRLLRGAYDADEAGIFVEKARLSLAVAAPDARPGALRVAGGTTRQLIFNTSDGNQPPVRFAKDHHFTAVHFAQNWYHHNPTPGVYNWDSLRVALDLCRKLGLKAQVNFALRRQRNTSGLPQDHEPFFPESELMTYTDGSLYQYQVIGDKFDVVPSLSSAQGMAAIETFMKAAATFLKPYYDDGTLLNVLAVIGQQGEMNYPLDETPNKVRWTDYSQATLNEYRNTYLPNRYGSIAALNKAWSSYYASFADVAYPEGPSPGNQYPNMNTEANRDWIRFGIRKIKDLTTRCRSALQSVVPIPFSYFASELAYYWYSIPFRATNIPYMSGGLDGIYTSAGEYGGDMEGAKLGWVDVIKGTLGSDKLVEIEFDNNDLSSTPEAFDQASLIRSLGSRFFDKGGEYIHITPLGGFNWGAVDDHLRYLHDAYCSAPNNGITPRVPVASASYNWTKLITGDEVAPFNAWRSVSGPSQQVDVKCIDDFNIDQIAGPPPSSGGGSPPPAPACTYPAALVATSAATLGSDLQLTASFDGGTNEPNVTYQWVRPDGSVATGQTYSFGDPAKAPTGNYTFKALRNSEAACLTVNLSANGPAISQ